jgi:hypothetical protein
MLCVPEFVCCHICLSCSECIHAPAYIRAFDILETPYHMTIIHGNGGRGEHVVGSNGNIDADGLFNKEGGMYNIPMGNCCNNNLHQLRR